MYVECEAATGYRFDATLDTSDGHADPDMVVSKNGRLCYTANYVAPTWTYADPSGAVVATATTGTETTTGTCPALDGPGAAPETYRIDTRDPRCALIDCTPGSCP